MNYEEFKPPPDPKDWSTTSEGLLAIAKKLEDAGADCIVLCANTPHMAADVIQQNIRIPLIHIAEETAKEIAKQNIKKVALLGTKLTMEQPFFRTKLSDHGLETIIPEDEERSFINSTIFNELGKGIFPKEIKKKYLQIIESLRGKGAEGIILGCTEIPMLIKPGDCSIQLFDTTLIHATAAVNFALVD
jgi:aspartate racemase